MEILLPYGGRLQSADVAKLGGRFRCNFPPALSDSEINQRLESSLSDIARKYSSAKTLVIVNDAFRRTPLMSFLPFLRSTFPKAEFAVATGSHRPPDRAGLSRIFGAAFLELEDRIIVHDCFDEAAMVDIGTTSRGTPVLLNRAVVESELILAVNSVEPHFFAGFTGGRKSIIPGLASLATIMANHRLAKDPQAALLRLDDNPLHNDLEEALDLLSHPRIYGIQCITDRNLDIVDLYADELRTAFAQACRQAEKIYTIAVPRKYEIVIACCEPPLDENLYQLQKAQENGGLMTADGGVLIVMGACRGGVGSDYFIRLAEKYPTPESALGKGILDDSFGMHKLIKTARQLKHFRIFYVTELDWTIPAKVYFEPFGDLAAALAAAYEIVGKEAEVAVLEDAGYSVPIPVR